MRCWTTLHNVSNLRISSGWPSHPPFKKMITTWSITKMATRFLQSQVWSLYFEFPLFDAQFRMEPSLRLPRIHHTKPNDPQHICVDGNHFALLCISHLMDNEMEGTKIRSKLVSKIFQTSSIFVSGDGIANPVSSAEQISWELIDFDPTHTRVHFSFVIFCPLFSCCLLSTEKLSFSILHTHLEKYMFCKFWERKILAKNQFRHDWRTFYLQPQGWGPYIKALPVGYFPITNWRISVSFCAF